MDNNQEFLSYEQILVSLSALLIFTIIIYLLKKEKFNLSITAILPFGILILIAAINPKNIKDLVYKGSNGDEFRLSTYVPNESELKKVNQKLQTIFEPESHLSGDLQNSILLENAKNRSFYSRSDNDFLLMAIEAFQNKDIMKSLQIANFGLYVSQNENTKSSLESLIAILYSKLKKKEKAIVLAKKAVERSPENVFSLNILATFLESEHKHQLAKDLYQKALNINSKYIAVYLNLSSLLKKEDKQESIRLLEKAIIMNHKDYRPYIHLAFLLPNTEFKRKKELLLTALRYNRDSIKANFNLALLFYEKSDFDSAKVYFERLKEVAPNFADSYYYLGLIYNQKQIFYEAKKMFEQAIKKEPKTIKLNQIKTELIKVKKILKINSIK